MLRNWETYGSFVDSDLERGPGAVDPETISRFDAAFAKLPRYDGIMYSNMQFGNSWGFGNRSKGVTFTEQDAAKRFIPGTTHASKGYFSGTPEPDVAMGFNRRFGLDVALAIKTSTARDLRPVATMPYQAEVILAREKPLTVTVTERVPKTSEQASGSGRFVVFANTPGSSPIRESEVDPEWLAWARRSKEDAAR